MYTPQEPPYTKSLARFDPSAFIIWPQVKTLWQSASFGLLLNIDWKERNMNVPLLDLSAKSTVIWQNLPNIIFLVQYLVDIVCPNILILCEVWPIRWNKHYGLMLSFVDSLNVLASWQSHCSSAGGERGYYRFYGVLYGCMHCDFAAINYVVRSRLILYEKWNILSRYCLIYRWLCRSSANNRIRGESSRR